MSDERAAADTAALERLRTALDTVGPKVGQFLATLSEDERTALALLLAPAPDEVAGFQSDPVAYATAALDALADVSDQHALRLQMTLDYLSKQTSMLTNLLTTGSDTQRAITQRLR